MEQYLVSGMSCAACQARVEKAVSGVKGVKSCSVSLLTNSMGVEGTADPQDILQAVEKAGYKAERKNAQNAASAGKSESISEKMAREEEALKDHETPKLRRRLLSSLFFLLILMYFSMGHTMWDFPIPAFFENPVSIGLLELILTLIILGINGRFFSSGFRSLVHLAPNMDTLVALGSTAAFCYSLVGMFLMINSLGEGNTEHVAHLFHGHLYFESSAMIVTLITVGKMLEAMSKGRTTDALKSLMRLAPQKATVLREGGEKEVSIDEVAEGDLFVVKPGESIPVDGMILKGSSAVNEAALTGESIPVDKKPGDLVYTGTINQAGNMTCKATKVGEDTSLSKIIRMVSDAAATKAPLARMADRVSAVFVPAVMLISFLTCVGWLLAGRDFGFAIARAISVLVISCPCALGLATPVSIMVGNGVGARNGILYKTAQSLEESGRCSVVVLDKTGTLTKGTPSVTDVIPLADNTSEDLLEVAYSLESMSEHPLAHAVVAYGKEHGLKRTEVTSFSAVPGNGLTGVMNGERIYGGNAGYLAKKITLNTGQKQMVDELAGEGKTPLYFATEKKVLGIIAVADTLKEDSVEAIRQMKKQGLQVMMLTGDHRMTAEAIGYQAGVDRVISEVLPDEKEAVIRQIQEKDAVIMVGDGINDAPALTRANIGMAIGAGADVAMDAADVVLVKSRLTDVSSAIRLSRATIRNIRENLFWAFFYNLICIPLAMGLYGIAMKPMYAAAAMSLSSFCVCMNALRLNLFKVHDASKDQPGMYVRRRKDPKKNTGKKDDTKEEEKMQKTLNIEGMMCGHCEMNVKKALEAVEGVAAAEVSHEAGTAVVTLTGEVADEVLKKAVEDKDYKVTAIA